MDVPESRRNREDSEGADKPPTRSRIPRIDPISKPIITLQTDVQFKGQRVLDIKLYDSGLCILDFVFLDKIAVICHARQQR